MPSTGFKFERRIPDVGNHRALPARGDIRCPKEERDIFRAALEEWRNGYWEPTTREANPMLSRAWALGERNIKQLVDNIRLIVCAENERLDRRWVRALINTTTDDATVDSLSAMIHRFCDGMVSQPCDSSASSRAKSKRTTRPKKQCR